MPFSTSGTSLLAVSLSKRCRRRLPRADTAAATRHNIVFDRDKRWRCSKTITNNTATNAKPVRRMVALSPTTVATHTISCHDGCCTKRIMSVRKTITADMNSDSVRIEA